MTIRAKAVNTHTFLSNQNGTWLGVSDRTAVRSVLCSDSPEVDRGRCMAVGNSLERLVSMRLSPSSRQKLSVSSLYGRLHFGQIFTDSFNLKVTIAHRPDASNPENEDRALDHRVWDRP